MEQKDNKTNFIKGILMIAVIVIIAVSVISVVLINDSSGDKSASSRSDKKTEAVADEDDIGKDNVDDEQIESSDYTTDEEDTDEESVRLRHAPNIYVDWVSSSPYASSYDAFIIDWKCTESAEGTYWAVHNWDGGYAGFQDKGNMGKFLLLSLWDLYDGTQPQVEYYSSDYDYGDFNHEGSGAYVFTPYEWKEGVWYSMKIEITYEGEKTLFTQYVCEEGGDWLKTAALSYPVRVEIDIPTHVFQEDFDFNDLPRSCMLRNAAGRYTDSGEWDYWNEFSIDSSYYPYDERPEYGVWSVDYGCDYIIYEDAVEIFSGGRGDKSNGKEMPCRGRIN